MITIVTISGFVYKNFLKKIIFLFRPEYTHRIALALGFQIGKYKLFTNLLSIFLCYKNQTFLQQNLFGINFANPVGLAAGFDYEAKLTNILPSLGFGFGSVGTVTNHAYKGNPGPILGRLPKSKSLMVNKGFKNFGIKKTMDILKTKDFYYPVGISIGKTNYNHETIKEAINDVVEAFKTAETSGIPFSYYELNISCPNLTKSIEFYDPQNLDCLLQNIETLHLKRPLFIKMPISKKDNEILAMIKVIIKYTWVQAVIIGNLQTDRSEPKFDKEEVIKYKVGNFSGAPCQKRSDELISLIYQNFGKNIKIIGCGGIFSAKDTYEKIKRGASLVQIITGLVFEGPQLASDINSGIVKLLKQDGYNNIEQAVGSETINS